MAIVHSLLVCFCWTFAFCIFNHYCLFYWRSAVKESDERFGSNLWTVMKRAKENSLLCVCRKDNRCGAHRRFNYDWFFFATFLKAWLRPEKDGCGMKPQLPRASCDLNVYSFFSWKKNSLVESFGTCLTASRHRSLFRSRHLTLTPPVQEHSTKWLVMGVRVRASLLRCNLFNSSLFLHFFSTSSIYCVCTATIMIK